MGPAWTRGEMERPAGEKSMGTWTAAVFTPEQQARLHVDEMGEPVVAQEPEPPPAVDEIREVMYSYVSSATYMGARHQPCRHRTSLCPDRCGHAIDVFTFKLDALAVTKNEESGSVRWVTPEKEGTERMIGESDLKEFAGLAKSLAAGDTVDLRWSHDYVTVGGSSGPDRPCTHLARAAGGDSGGLWEGPEALAQEREMAAQQQRERASAQELRHDDPGLPSLEADVAALDSLRMIHSMDVTELKSYDSPPAVFQQVMQAVCILMSRAPTWAESRMLMGDARFLQKLKEFDKDAVSRKQLKQLEKHLAHPEAAGRVSKAAKGLAMWVLGIAAHTSMRTGLKIRLPPPPPPSPHNVAGTCMRVKVSGVGSSRTKKPSTAPVWWWTGRRFGGAATAVVGRARIIQRPQSTPPRVKVKLTPDSTLSSRPVWDDGGPKEKQDIHVPGKPTAAAVRAPAAAPARAAAALEVSPAVVVALESMASQLDVLSRCVSGLDARMGAAEQALDRR